ncbi:hypothetical protein [Chitinophaga ginsengisegetis]|uniref:hypothetical protein n=1 Tax=Chitinophaga ginsengisegetis TaxID=393003 RepID=UPI000DBAA39B|nr:hypothetical protein [Chitinophaga ginsengisegetis]MDR6567980.1 hypothetical protein [Chitinophaga ginsengisegetis]MDR6647465.1 hypothetical protein [Chitinophaga ginsengisegetis]MDR6653815.1 hypothetical protein [Chitinophaga ginsengisegetis]
MMRSISYFLAFFIFALSACDSPDLKSTEENKKLLIGKWHRFSIANGYSEFDIDSQYIVFYNQKVGRFGLPYKIENDSLKYLTNNYAAKITDYGDSVLLEGNDSTKATLYRFKEPHVPFKTIPEAKDSLLFASYIAGFDKRLIREFEKAGIKISDGTEKPDL